MTFPLGAPLLDACVLAVLEKEDAYGYSLTQRMKEVVELSESTLYPVLRRLQQSGCLTVYDKPFQGRNRRYYAITPAGRGALAEQPELIRQVHLGYFRAGADCGITASYQATIPGLTAKGYSRQ